MKRIILGLSVIAISFSTYVFASIPVINNSIPFDTLPSEIKEEIDTYYIEACQNIADSEEFQIEKPQITFEDGFLTNIDFNGDGLNDYIIHSLPVNCEGAYTMFTGNSLGFLDIYFQNKMGKYDHVLNYWLGREGLELKKDKNGYRYYSKENKSYLLWDKQQSKFLSYYGPEKRLDVLEVEDRNASMSQTSSESRAILNSVFTE